MSWFAALITFNAPQLKFLGRWTAATSCVVWGLACQRILLCVPVPPSAFSCPYSAVPQTAPSCFCYFPHDGSACHLEPGSWWEATRRVRYPGSASGLGRPCASEPGEKSGAFSVFLYLLHMAAKLLAGGGVSVGAEFYALIPMVACLQVFTFPQSGKFCYCSVLLQQWAFPMSYRQGDSNLFPADSFCLCSHLRSNGLCLGHGQRGPTASPQ